MSTKTSKENNQSKKSVCCGAEKMIPGDYVSGVGVFPGDPICSKCQKPWEPCHSSQDLEGECECGMPLLKGKDNLICISCDKRVSKPVSEGKGEPKYQCKSCRKFFPKAKIIEDALYFHCHNCMKEDCPTPITPPSNALRSEEELRKEWLEVGQMEFKMFAGYASMVADWWIAKLTSERQRAYFEGVQNGINECKPEFDLARADERKKMGEILEREIEIWFLRLHNEPERWTVKQAMDYISALLNKHQDK